MVSIVYALSPRILPNAFLTLAKTVLVDDLGGIELAIQLFVPLLHLGFGHSACFSSDGVKRHSSVIDVLLGRTRHSSPNAKARGRFQMALDDGLATSQKLLMPFFISRANSLGVGTDRIKFIVPPQCEKRLRTPIAESAAWHS